MSSSRMLEMDIDLQGILEEFLQSTAHVMDNNELVDERGLNQSPTCACCERFLVLDNDVSGEPEAIGICSDCKFLLLEDMEFPEQDSYNRALPRGRRTRHGSSESLESRFSQEFSHMINLVRQSQSSISSYGDRYADGSNATYATQDSSLLMSPNQSRRWHRANSDSENDGLDSIDSMFRESGSNFSFGSYRHSYGDIDFVSYRTYGGDSDASMDGRSSLDTDVFVFPGDGFNDTDIDIDPMRAGVGDWDLSDEEEDLGELTEADTEQDALEVESSQARPPLQDFQVSSASGRVNSGNWNEQLSSPEYELERIRRNGRFYSNMNYSQSELLSFVENFGEYLDQQGFEQLLEQIAMTTSSRRGAPPAAVSSVKNLPLLVISKEHLKHDNISCAICKDFLHVSVEVNQLPCLHLYHPSCIMPWLSTRNSCPLCRYELPTDDRDYEEGKRSSINTAEVQVVGANLEFRTSQGEELNNIDSAVNNSNNSGRHDGIRSWVFVAAPIVGLAGIALMLWFGSPRCDQRVPGGQAADRRQLDAHIADALNQRENRSRRWW
ncbi:E3 ubiquitin-protein ligase Praja-2-like isoform X2 [Cucurbita pepo subsp. pepo]|uniref:E3 ubiquitin-protein ligase Praja-2-like isoform X2 n=1 Tax=Cucurbita pepo subsp. pepo TaxID=3664 RepID=UPI000C9D573D|nr:E3 ubiquitin-protein ligase Praja-2-like isoform X2 [Cucurbita pepo subsp. pepo]